jgi:hypothetical protein
MWLEVLSVVDGSGGQKDMVARVRVRVHVRVCVRVAVEDTRRI